MVEGKRWTGKVDGKICCSRSILNIYVVRYSANNICTRQRGFVGLQTITTEGLAITKKDPLYEFDNFDG